MKVYLFFLCTVFLVTFSPSILNSQVMNDYCQYPTSISTPVEPNVLLVIDVSGSMSWKAYSYGDSDSNGDNVLDRYNPNVTYEGYFDPRKYYTQDNSGIYVETTPSGVPCTTTCTKWVCRTNTIGCYMVDPRGTRGCSSTRWPCCTEVQQSGDCNIYSGNYLNYALMSRMDVLRWALTGGSPDSCNNTVRSCNPEVYPDPQLSCDSYGCVLKSTDGSTKVKVPWERITGPKGGLLFQLKSLSPRPLIGAIFYSGTGVRRTVYIGDFTASANYDAVNPYKNVITAVNYEPPSGATPSGPALWDAYNYLRQAAPRYGGPNPQSGEGDKWKNPMYRCYDRNNDGNCQGNEFELVPCAKNFVILMSDGQWNYGCYPVKSSCKIDDDVESESPDPVIPAYYMHKLGFVNQPTGISTYVESVYTVGLWLGGTGELSLKNVSIYGSFDRSNNWPGGTNGFPTGTCGPVDDCCSYANCGKGSSCTQLPPSSPDWDKNGDGIPDTFYEADDAIQIKVKLAEIILDILKHVSTGTAVSVLASSEGSGANLLQAMYYPKKSFGDEEISWMGKIHNLWYYVDPYLELTSIREDTNSDRKLDLRFDYVVQFYYDSMANEAMVNKYADTDGDGTPNSFVMRDRIDNVKSLWEAGQKLWQRDIGSSPRRIYTHTGGSIIEFSVSNLSSFMPYLNVTNATEAEKVVRFILGEDIQGARSRTVTIGGVRNVWRLGDIVNSTPKIQSFNPINSYHLDPPLGYADSTYKEFISTESYRQKGVVYVGANDGMLHAFYLGNLKQDWTGRSVYEKGYLEGSDLGKELWAFIPKNALPYLKYLLDPDYCHIYYVDASPHLVDASINGNADDLRTKDSWRTILIGGMGLGGATRNYGSTCTRCIKSPISNVGFSSYFAIDVTDPENPQILWEFSDPELGLTTSGPAIVRQGESTKNGKWFVVFISGPTGPIDTNYHQFLGKSDQNLKIFILDLKTGSLLRKIDTGISNAFGSSLSNATIDTDRSNNNSLGFYKDDAIYFGFTQCEGENCTKGGVLRLLTNESANPSDWNLSVVINNVGPVTASVAKLQDRTNGTLWLFFGTGRYFYKAGAEIDDPGNPSDQSTRRRIFGIKEPCYLGSINDINQTCSLTVNMGSLKNQTVDPALDISSYQGWYINLDPPDSYYLQERVITDPLATSFGAVFFTTFRPSSDICSVGGGTHVWAIKYDTGGQITGLKGKALLQVSTGEIREMNLSTFFTQKEGRRSVAITGMPPKGQGLSILIPPPPQRRVLHIKER
ncbi:MAG: PilC/PilY family type IV pilus protein [Deltaproteobacteria bacterium]|nr:PilC/PilY family type IV pilus protein [Deltaproteobacteria bacterium]